VLNAEVDFTALEALDQVRDELAQDGTVFALARVKQDLLVRLKAFGLTAKIGPGLLFPALPTAVAAYRGSLGPGCPAAARRRWESSLMLASADDGDDFAAHADRAAGWRVMCRGNAFGGAAAAAAFCGCGGSIAASAASWTGLLTAPA
jgi:hypothetical protein